MKVANIEMQLYKRRMLTGGLLVLRPYLAQKFESVTMGVLYGQLRYRANGSGLQPIEGRPALRMSYTRIHRMLPFLSKRWIKELVRRLRERNALEIHSTGRVNILTFDPADELHLAAIDAPEYSTLGARMLISVELAVAIGLQEALAIQQVHVRHCLLGGGFWVIRSLPEWQSQVFPFMSGATVQRLFARLRAQDLLYMSKYANDGGWISAYRVNYLKVAEVLGIPPPITNVPKGYLDPLHPPPISE